MKFFRSIAKAIVWVMIGAVITNIGMFLYAYTSTNKAVENRLNDIAQMVSTEGAVTSEMYDSFCNLLASTESNMTRFHSTNTSMFVYGSENASQYGPDYVNQIKSSNVLSFEKSNDGGNSFSAMGLGYANAVQRLKPIKVTLRGYVSCPVLLLGNVRISGNSSLLTIEKSVIVLGQKFYKGLA